MALRDLKNWSGKTAISQRSSPLAGQPTFGEGVNSPPKVNGRIGQTFLVARINENTDRRADTETSITNQ